MTDAHLHLQFEEVVPFHDEIFRLYSKLGIKRVVTNGTEPADWPAVEMLARERACVIPSFGLHPWDVNEAPEEWEKMLGEFLDRHPLAGVGECGMDSWVRDHDLDRQEAAFRVQIRLATEGNRALSVHGLKCWGRMLEVLKSERLPERGFLLHAYGGPVEMVGPFAALGAFFSFNGSFLAEKKASKRDAFASVPPDRFLIETDAPAMPLPAALSEYALATTVEDSDNHPANLVVTYREAERVFGITPETANENFERFFGVRT
ncbi:MAG: TatD family hydrolase [Verrucomicrobiota bacterium]